MVLRHTRAAKPLPWLSDNALALLRMHGWPGNVRELENVVRRALLLAEGQDDITAAHIVFDSPARLVAQPGEIDAPAPRRLSSIVQVSEERAIMAALDQSGGNRIAAARELGISERTLRYRLAAFRDGTRTAIGAGR